MPLGKESRPLTISYIIVLAKSADAQQTLASVVELQMISLSAELLDITLRGCAEQTTVFTTEL